MDVLDSERKLQISQANRDAEKFSKLFYENLDKRRHMISKFYMDAATLIWNGNGVTGKDAIMQFYEHLPSSKIEIMSLDCQPVLGIAVNNQTTIMVNVLGTILFQGKSESRFYQTFILTEQNGTWKILSDTFRIQETV